ncbi:MAG: PAS domain S-box protein [Bacteroidales bacterium]|nr:PAS domain S-box protein [Bacteroidales bacterium]
MVLKDASGNYKGYNRVCTSENNEERFHKIFDNAPVGISRTTIDGKLLLANRKLAEIFDFKDPESMINAVTNIAKDLYKSETLRNAAIEDLIKNGKHQNTYEIPTKSGEIRTIKLNAIACYNNSGQIEYIDSIIEDISEKIKLEVSLKERETILSSIINSLPFELWVSNLDGKILCQSAASTSFWGNNTGKNMDEVSIPEKTLNHWKEKSKKVLKGKVIHFNGDVDLEGKTYYFHRIMAPLTDGNKIEGVISLSIDITGQKLAEEELKKSEEKYRHLMDNMNEVVMIVDNDDRVQYVNKKFTEKFGYKPKEIIGKIGNEVLLDPEDRTIIIEANKMRTLRVTSQYEICFRSKKGEKIYFLVSGAPIIDKGNVTGSIGTMTDITDRKIMELALRESEELFRKLVDLTPYSIVVNDMEGRFMMINSSFSKNTGLNLDRILGKTAAEIGYNIRFINDFNFREELQTHGSVNNIEAEIIKENGEVVFVLLSCKLIQMNNIPAILTSTVDITDKRKIQVELEQHKNSLEILVKERTEEIEILNQELIATNEELYQNNDELNMVNEALAIQKKQLEQTIEQLQLTQTQLIQSEKMASIGILTAGIAHEINNPINFISSGITGLELIINDV